RLRLRLRLDNTLRPVVPAEDVQLSILDGAQHPQIADPRESGAAGRRVRPNYGLRAAAVLRQGSKYSGLGLGLGLGLGRGRSSAAALSHRQTKEKKPIDLIDNRSQIISRRSGSCTRARTRCWESRTGSISPSTSTRRVASASASST